MYKIKAAPDGIGPLLLHIKVLFLVKSSIYSLSGHQPGIHCYDCEAKEMRVATMYEIT